MRPWMQTIKLVHSLCVPKSSECLNKKRYFRWPVCGGSQVAARWVKQHEVTEWVGWDQWWGRRSSEVVTVADWAPPAGYGSAIRPMTADHTAGHTRLAGGPVRSTVTGHVVVLRPTAAPYLHCACASPATSPPTENALESTAMPPSQLHIHQDSFHCKLKTVLFRSYFNDN